MTPVILIHLSSIFKVFLNTVRMIQHAAMRFVGFSYGNPDRSWHLLRIGPKVKVMTPSFNIHATSIIIVTLVLTSVVHQSALKVVSLTNNYPFGILLPLIES